MDNVSDKFTCKTVQDSGREAEDGRRHENQTSDIDASDIQVIINGVNDNTEQDSHVQYRTKITPDGRIVRVILSDGETSSGIESVSSVDSVNDFTSNHNNSLMKNVLVEVKNEIAFEYSEGDMMKTIKEVSIYKQQFSKSLEESDGIPPSYESHEEDFYEKTDLSINSCEKELNNTQRCERSESRGSSNKSDERISKKSRSRKRSRSSKRWSSKKSNSSHRSRSGSSPRRRLSSRERKKSKSSSRRKNRSSSRRGRTSSSRRRSRSVSRKRHKSSSRRRSRSLSRRRRRSSSGSRRRSSSGKRRRSLSGRRYKSLSRERSRSLVKKGSRSLSRRRSRSVTKRSLKTLSRRLKERSEKKLKSRDGNSTRYEKRESGSIEEGSSGSYYSTTETRRRGFPNGGFQSTTIQVHSGYFPPFVDRNHYYWRGVHRFPRGYVRGRHHPSIKRHHSSVTDEDYPKPKSQKKPGIELATSDSSASSSKEDRSRDGSQEGNQTETSSEVNVTVLTPETKVFSDSEERTLPEKPKVTDYGSPEVSKCRLPLPTVGLDNVPLVPGPNGLPVHITSTGKTIPYDMDGRRVPIGPNGHHLPLDASGRLFPHVITLDNNAVPIYISEDGVLRLPDSRPVPFGSPHKLPVNIDGKMILMGPDSRPLLQHPNLPVKPPIYTPQAGKTENAQKSSGGLQKNEKSEPSQRINNLDIEVGESNPSNDVNESKSVDSESDSDSTYFSQLLQRPIEKEPVSNISPDSILKKLIDSVDTNLLRKVQVFQKPLKKTMAAKMVETFGDELTQEKPTQRVDDLVVNKIKSVLKTLYESKYQGPQFGRFILPKVMFEHTESGDDFESPLLKNKIRLPFITPGAVDVLEKKETVVPYTFLSNENVKVFEKTTEEEEEEVQIIEEYTRRDIRQRKPKTACVGVQCDFTTDMLNESNSAVSRLKKEVVSLQNAYQNLFEMYERACAKAGATPENME